MYDSHRFTWERFLKPLLRIVSQMFSFGSFFFLPLPLTGEAQQASLNLIQILQFTSLFLLLTFLSLVANIYMLFTVTVTITMTFF